MGVQMAATIGFVLFMRFSRDAAARAKMALGMPAPPLGEVEYIKFDADRSARAGTDAIAPGLPAAFAEADGTGYVLLFWATWSRESRAAIPAINALARRFGKPAKPDSDSAARANRGVRFLAITSEPAATVRSFAQRLALQAGKGSPAGPFAFAAARAAPRLAQRYGLRAVPWTFVVYRGRVVWSGDPASPELAARLSGVAAQQLDARVREAEDRGRKAAAARAEKED
jgi:hypothetical protein